MGLKSRVLYAKVMHKRLKPKINQFSYDMYYLALPLFKLAAGNEDNVAINKFGLLSFYEKDHNTHNKSCANWIKNVLADHGLEHKVKETLLIAMPRVCGYIFNPVSFWFCLDSNNNLVAVVCEVCNTFGEKHNYLCLPTREFITRSDWLEASKMFHVSPFLERSGYYQFNFCIKYDKISIIINLYDSDSNKVLCTSLIGTLKELTKKTVYKVFITYPLITLKTIILIHYQALKLWVKNIKYVKKPRQLSTMLTKTKD